MKKQLAIISLMLAFTAGNAFAQIPVRGYYNHRSHSYVTPRYRNAPDHSRLNNKSTKGNSDPFKEKRANAGTHRRRNKSSNYVE